MQEGFVLSVYIYRAERVELITWVIRLAGDQKQDSVSKDWLETLSVLILEYEASTEQVRSLGCILIGACGSLRVEVFIVKYLSLVLAWMLLHGLILSRLLLASYYCCNKVCGLTVMSVSSNDFMEGFRNKERRKAAQGTNSLWSIACLSTVILQLLLYPQKGVEMLLYSNYNPEQKLKVCQKQPPHNKGLSQCKNNGIS